MSSDQRLRRWGRSLALGALAALAIFVSRAMAHAELVRSVPEANAILDRAPVQVELFFSEAVEGSFSSIQVLNSSGTAVDGHDTHLDPADATHLLVSLRSLPNGVYTVSWRALSAADGHVTVGAFPFSVGVSAGAAPAAGVQAGLQLPVPNLIAKWFIYLALAVLAGGRLFLLAVWQPVQRSMISATRAAETVRLNGSRMAVAALAIFALAMVSDWLLQVGQASGAFIAVPWSEGAAHWLFTTRLGAVWLVQMGLGLALAGVVATAGTHRLRFWRRTLSARAQEGLALGAAGLWLLSQSLASHAAGDPQPVLPVLADWVHLMAASAWVGGLIHFATGLWALRSSSLGANERTQFAALLIPRFSALALVSVALLTITGVYSAYLRIGSVQALFGSVYGWALVVKLLVALPMVVMGAFNLLVVTPTLQRAVGRLTSNLPLVGRFRGLVTGEMMLGFVLLFTVSLLTSLPPARILAEAGLTGSARADDVQVNLSITPGRVGVNTFRVKLLVNGQPLTAAQTVELRFTPNRANVAPSQAQLMALGGGDYAATGGFLGLPDTWQVQVVVRREGKFDAFANFSYVLGVASAAAPFPWNRVSGLLLLAVGLAYLFALNRLSHSRRQLIAAGLLPTLALAVAALGVFYGLPFSTGTSRANPVPANTELIGRGHTLYIANCQPCHGASGRGHGPVGLTLNPRPADLTAHAVAGVHTDAQLYDWISNGYPGSLMPAFGQRLSETDRWDLVNFIRTFAPH